MYHECWRRKDSDISGGGGGWFLLVVKILDIFHLNSARVLLDFDAELSTPLIIKRKAVTAMMQLLLSPWLV